MTFDPKTTAALLRKETALRPALGMVLGSGFQQALTHLEVAREIAYGQLPGFPTVGVTGHAGRLVIGTFDKIPVLALKGRAHYYEGVEMERLTFPVRVLAELGIRTLLLTNAAGAINRVYRSGDFMALEDHINFMGANPLRGPGGTTFLWAWPAAFLFALPILYCNAFLLAWAWAAICRRFWPPGCPISCAAARGCCCWPECGENPNLSFP